MTASSSSSSAVAALHPPTELCQACVSDCAVGIKQRATRQFYRNGKTDDGKDLASVVNRIGGDGTTGVNVGSAKPDVFMDMKFTNDDATQPSLCHVIFSNVNFVDMYRVRGFCRPFERVAYVREPRSHVRPDARKCCTVEALKPRAYLENCIVRTFSTEMYERSRVSVNVVFIFSIHPAQSTAERWNGGSGGGLFEFPMKLYAWESKVESHVTNRLLVQEALEGHACDNASIALLRDMVKHVFTKTFGMNVVQPSSVDVMWMSSALRNSPSARDVELSSDADGHHRAIGNQHSSDIVIRVFRKLPIYVSTLIRRWDDQQTPDGVPWKCDTKWTLVNVVAEQPRVCDSHGVGPVYLCLMYIDLIAAASRNKTMHGDGVPSLAASSVGVSLPCVSTRTSSRKRCLPFGGRSANPRDGKSRASFADATTADDERVLHHSKRQRSHFSE